MGALTQAAALMAIYNATGGPTTWSDGGRGKGRAGWGSHADVCSWAGVCCLSNATEWACTGADTGVVQGLNLGFNGLTGVLPSDPAVWQTFPSLQSLSVRSNALSGSLPTALRRLTSLRDLNARRNRISGSVPDLATLTQLRHFSLSVANRVSGTLGSWIGAMRSLGMGAEGGLDLTANRLSGTIPAAISELRGFHDDIGLGSGYTCPVPPVTFANGTVSTTYAQCHGGRPGGPTAGELVAFRSVSYGCSHGNNCIQSSFLHYNWSAISTVISFTETNLTELCAVASANAAKVVVAKGKTLNTSRLAQPGYSQAWTTNMTQELLQLREVGVSGLSLDVEHFRGSNPVQTKRLFTKLVCDLHSALAQQGQSLHSICTKIWGDTTHFDLPALSQCTEYILPMAYDMISKSPVASSNAPLPAITQGLHDYYLSAGVPPTKILLGLPLYGYAFPCESNDYDDTSSDDDGLTPTAATPLLKLLNNETSSNDNGGGSQHAPPCRVAATTAVSDWQIGLGTIFEKEAAGLTTNAGRDAASGSAFLEFAEAKHKPLGRRQVRLHSFQPHCTRQHNRYTVEYLEYYHYSIGELQCIFSACTSESARLMSAAKLSFRANMCRCGTRMQSR